jgi:hypothetical protein
LGNPERRLIQFFCGAQVLARGCGGMSKSSGALRITSVIAFNTFGFINYLPHSKFSQ